MINNNNNNKIYISCKLSSLFLVEKYRYNTHHTYQENHVHIYHILKYLKILSNTITYSIKFPFQSN